jgi:hypothetical protein
MIWDYIMSFSSNANFNALTYLLQVDCVTMVSGRVTVNMCEVRILTSASILIYIGLL